MANRRMFSKVITNSSNFLMMPQSAQNLYFHLGMNADDDGFCEHFTIMRMTESKPDDLKILQAKGFIHIFDDKILIIMDWKENNYIRSDRYSSSKYLKAYKKEIKMLSEGKSGIPNVYQGETQVRLGKVRLGKDIILHSDEVAGKDINLSIELFKPINPSYKQLFKNITQRNCLDRLLKEHGNEKIEQIINILPRTNKMQYAPVITTPYELENKLGALLVFISKEKLKVENNKLKIAIRKTE